MGGIVYPNLGTGVIQINDLVFALHAFFGASSHLTQVFIYERGTQEKFKSWSKYLLIILWTVILTTFLFEALFGVSGIPSSANTLKMAGYGKAIITL